MSVIISILAVIICLPFPAGAVIEDFAVSDPSWFVPAGVTEITVYVWGGGGGGGGAEFSGPAGRAGGGGGGAYAIKVFTVSPGDECVITVGISGLAGASNGGNGGTGGASSFVNLDTPGSVTADGGNGGGGSTSGNPGLGGSGGASGTGDTNYSGGHGADGATDSGGGGGGAGTAGSGGSASGANGGSGTSLWGGDGADGLNVEGSGNSGFSRGGGGSGGHCITADQPGGAGAPGFVRVVYDLAPIGISKDWDLSFGSFTVGPAAGTLTIAADSAGSRSSSGDVFVVTSTHRSAKFNVTGASVQFVADLVNPPSFLTGPGNIPVTFAIGYVNQADASAGEVYVGGELSLTGSEAAGTYSANPTLTIDYE